MYKYVVYLAGRIHGLTYREASNWRNSVKKVLSEYEDIEIIDPLDGEEKLAELDEPINFTNEALTGLKPSEVYLNDIESVRKSTHILAYLPQGTGHGTSYEIGYAQGLNDYRNRVLGFSGEFMSYPYKRIIVVADPEWKNHPFMTKDAGVEFCTNLKDALRIISLDYFIEFQL